MARVAGILKFMVSVAGTVILIMLIFNLNMDDRVQKALTIAIISLVYGIYMYYLILTAIWNMNDRVYKVNILLIAGVLLQFSLIIGVLYACYTRLPIRVFITNCFASTIGLIITFYDSTQLYKSWKNRKPVTI